MKNVVRVCLFATLFLVAPYTFANAPALSIAPLPTCLPNDPQCTPVTDLAIAPLPTCLPNDPQCTPVG